jgi:hemin uptake protein HemP
MIERDDKGSWRRNVGDGAESTKVVPAWQVVDLMKGGVEAEILHDGQVYRLRITSNRKLILTK